jgi:HEAT repeat protein
MGTPSPSVPHNTPICRHPLADNMLPTFKQEKIMSIPLYRRAATLATVFLGMTLLTGTGVGQENVATDELAKDSALENLKDIEAWAKHNKIRASRPLDSSRIQNAMEALKRHPETSAPLLIDEFVDQSKDGPYRANCAEILRETGHKAPAAYHPKIEAILRDAKENPIARIDAADLLLRSQSHPSAATKKAIREMASKFLREGQEPGRIYQLVLKHLIAMKDVGTEDLLLSELRRGADIGPAMHALGRIGSKKAVDPIASMLESRMNDRFYPRARGYLALGEIGGSRAYDALVGLLKREQDRSNRHMIVWALGLTKDSRAKRTLLDYVAKKEPADFYAPALQGLQYLGDKTVVPELQKLLKDESTAFKRERLKKAIDALNAGNNKPDW